MIVIAAMWFVTHVATLPEGRLMMNLLGLEHLRLVRVARQADLDTVCLGEPRLAAGMRAVTVCAISCGSGVRHLRCFNGLGLFGMAHRTQFFAAGCREHYLS